MVPCLNFQAIRSREVNGEMFVNLQGPYRLPCMFVVVISHRQICTKHVSLSWIYQQLLDNSKVSLAVYLLVSAMGVTRVYKGAKPSLFLPTTSPVTSKARRQCCIVLGCESNRYENLHGNFHSFPRDAVRRTHWQLVCRLLKTTRNTRICSQHFHNSDFHLKGNFLLFVFMELKIST